jgi:uncharacterized RDD family membrane protein YckC
MRGSEIMEHANPYAAPTARVERTGADEAHAHPARIRDWLLAGAFDVFVMSLAGAVLMIGVAWLLGSAGGAVNDGEMSARMAGLSAGFFALGAVGLLYAPLLESSAWQATLGKRRRRICLVTSSGERVGFGRALRRHLVHVATLAICLVFPPLVLALIAANGVLLRFGPTRQTLHDMAAGVHLVSVAPDRGSPWLRGSPA